MNTSSDTRSDARLGFSDPDLLVRLAAMRDDELDLLDFGVIVGDLDHRVVAYNAYESARAGISPERVLGRHLFDEVAPCTNNYLVSQRYLDALELGQDLDEELDYVFTLRMAPTPVRLRLLAGPASARVFLLVRPR